MWFFETNVTHLLDKKYQNKYWIGITKTWYTLSSRRLGQPGMYDPYFLSFIQEKP